MPSKALNQSLSCQSTKKLIPSNILSYTEWFSEYILLGYGGRRTDTCVRQYLSKEGVQVLKLGRNYQNAMQGTNNKLPESVERVIRRLRECSMLKRHAYNVD